MDSKIPLKVTKILSGVVKVSMNSGLENKVKELISTDPIHPALHYTISTMMNYQQNNDYQLMAKIVQQLFDLFK